MITTPLTIPDANNRNFRITVRKRLTIKSSAIIKAMFFSNLPSRKNLFQVYNKQQLD